MVFRHEHQGGVWIDLEQPDENEIREIAREFSINERMERELLAPTPVPTVAGDAGVALLVLHFPAHGAQDGETKSQEIDFVIGKHFIITVRYELVAPLHHLKKLLETQQLVAKKTHITTDLLLEILFLHLYTSMRDHTNHIADNLARVEKDMFDGRERLTVRAISNISREFLHVEAALTNQEEPLKRFLQMLEEHVFFGPAFAARALRINAERAHVARVVRTHRAVATELRETNLALLESRQNEIMKTLTMITVVVLPLELIAFIFDMHAPGTPLLENPNAFKIIMGLMLAAVALTVMYFARKRWIF